MERCQVLYTQFPASLNALKFSGLVFYTAAGSELKFLMQFFLRQKPPVEKCGQNWAGMWEFSPDLVNRVVSRGAGRGDRVSLPPCSPDPQVSCCKHLCQLCRTLPAFWVCSVRFVFFFFLVLQNLPCPSKHVNRLVLQKACDSFVFQVSTAVFLCVCSFCCCSGRNAPILDWLAGLLRACGEDFLNLGISCCEKSSLC